MRLALVTKEEMFKKAGVGVFNERLTKYLQGRGHQVFELRFAKKDFGEKGIYQIPYYVAGKRTMVLVPAIDSRMVLKDYLTWMAPEVVYMPLGVSPLDFLVPDLCHQMGIPLAVVWHGDMNRSRWVEEMVTSLPFRSYLPVCKRADLLQVFSEELKKFYEDRGVDGSKVLVLPNGVDSRFYTPGKSEFARKHGIKSGVLFLGRITKVKNPELLIKSFLAMNPEEGTKLVVVGEGELKEELEEKYQDKRIIFTGLIEDEKIKRDIIRSCQIFVLPSLFEGMSLSLLEAMSCRLCCVGSDAAGHRNLLSGAGVVIPIPQLKEELPKTLIRFLGDETLAVQLGKKARNRAVEDYDQGEIFRKLEKRLVRLVGKNTIIPTKSINGLID